MQQAATARAFLKRLYPWLGKAVHTRWTVHRSVYRREVDALLMELEHERGRMSDPVRLRLETLLGRLYREWFPRTWRTAPTYADVLTDLRWWITVAERWGEPPARAPRKRATPPTPQPKQLLKLLGLPHTTTKAEFAAAWRRFLKRNHPDLNPDQTPDERRRFAEAVALWRR